MCYLISLIFSLGSFLAWHRKKELKTWYLFLMFSGGALFGFIDHLWNGELFLVSGNIFKDLGLGVAIALATFIFWKIIIFVPSGVAALRRFE